MGPFHCIEDVGEIGDDEFLSEEVNPMPTNWEAELLEPIGNDTPGDPEPTRAKWSSPLVINARPNPAWTTG